MIVRSLFLIFTMLLSYAPCGRAQPAGDQAVPDDGSCQAQPDLHRWPDPCADHLGICYIEETSSRHRDNIETTSKAHPNDNQRATKAHPISLPVDDNERQWMTIRDHDDSAGGGKPGDFPFL